MRAPQTRTDAALELAHECGFDLAGVAPLRRPPDAERFERWLERGLHADMRWLEAYRARILDPARILPGARTLLVVGLGHARAPVALEGGARIARYAAGRDYHNVLTRRLRKLARRLDEAGIASRSRTVVDAGPLLERSHAEEAGLGFASRAANLLHPRFGPWFFLGELLLDADLVPTPAPPPGSCGTCTACLDACPTGALPEPGVVDANLCLSYHTIENRGPIPRGLREALGPWLFGCDVCSEVCPWGRNAPDASPLWGLHAKLAEATPASLLEVPEERFADELQGSPLRRTRREGLARNAALVLGNRPSDAGRAALLTSLERDPSPLVREAAFWALAQAHLGDRGTREALDRALLREETPWAHAAMGRSRDSSA